MTKSTSNEIISEYEKNLIKFDNFNFITKNGKWLQAKYLRDAEVREKRA
ncbi:hypothetical protein FACS1894113_3320 [Alphaproteobacteria bacterium]|nr:hypothetical protein FACS1894113_3320 [Alphaproteobacteria bacterium]